MSFYTNIIDKSKLYLKNLEKNKIVYKYLPAYGSASFLILSTEFTTPTLFSKVFGGYSLKFSNILMMNSIFGNFMYLYSRPHMRNLKTTQSLGYSLFGSLMFNFGTILFWVLSKSFLTENGFFLFFYGLLTGSGLLYAAVSYLKSIDQNTKQN